METASNMVEKDIRVRNVSRRRRNGAVVAESHETKNCRKKKDAAKTAAEKTAPRDTKQNENKEHTFAFVSSDT